jgi:hypothetical protein
MATDMTTPSPSGKASAGGLGLLVRIFSYFDRMDRRIIYGVVFASLLIPIVLKLSFEPRKMTSAEDFFNQIQKLQPSDDNSKIVFLAMDWSAATKAENEPQTEIVMEHLMRRGIKFAMITTDPQSIPFWDMPKDVAKRLEEEPEFKARNKHWEYGKDWVNLGFKPNLLQLLQQLPKTGDLRELFQTDYSGRPLKEIECLKNVKKFTDIPMLAEFTGSVGVFPFWVAYFQSKDHRPKFVHGCTSISIAETYPFLDSGQIVGLLEGVAGAAYYATLPGLGYTTDHASKGMTFMTAISLGHIMIVVFIVLGNLGMYIKKIGAKQQETTA